MTRGRLLFFALSSLVVLFLVAGSLVGAVVAGRGGEDSVTRYLSVFTEVLSLVRQTYVEERPVEGLLSGAFDGMTDALDPFSVYVPAARAEGFAAAEAVGARHSGLRLLKERGVAYVVGVEEGSPAAAAGVEPADLVAKVQGRSTRLLPVWELQEELAKPPGTRVELDLIRRGERRTVTLELGPFAAAAPRLERRDQGLVLRIPAFGPTTAADVEPLLREAAAVVQAEAGAAGATGAVGALGLLVDLRGVGGADPALAYPVADLFADGELGTLRSRETTVTAFQGTQPDLWRPEAGKLVVAVDRGTQGAAEVLAVVLRQACGARLVGERSFGHAGRQRLVSLSSGDRLRLTDAFYAGPDGDGIDEGLAPDVLVDERSRRFGEQDLPLRELILQRGLRLLREAQGAPAA